MSRRWALGLVAATALLVMGATLRPSLLFPGAPVRLQAGSASAPGVTFAGDEDTGLLNPAANALAVTTGGTERARVDAAGQVGIGVTNPLNTLHVAGAVLIRDSLHIGSSVGIGLASPSSRLHIAGSAEISDRLRTGIVSAGRWSGNLIFDIDNTSDFGASDATRARDAFVARNLHVQGYLHVQASAVLGVHVVTISNNGAGGASNTEILSGLRPVYVVDCQDGDGCPVQLLETGVTAGTLVRIVSISPATHAVSMADVSGVQHVAGTMTMGPADAISLIYITDRNSDAYWVELGRSDN